MSTEKTSNEYESPKKTSNTPANMEASPKATIGDYHTAPSYMKDNEHITHGYRINFDNPKKIVKSLFMVHNESVNIWSHCIPALIICVFIISLALIVDHQQISKDLTYYKT
jgi:adiponectin receptor